MATYLGTAIMVMAYATVAALFIVGTIAAELVDRRRGPDATRLHVARFTMQFAAWAAALVAVITA